MSDFKVTINDPSRERKVKIHIDQPAGYKFLNQEHDTHGHRFVLAFFEVSPGAEEQKHDLTYDIEINEEGAVHSVSAMVICDGKVLAQDRKRIRSGMKES